MIRLVGAMLATQDDEWAIAKRYVNVESPESPKAPAGRQHALVSLSSGNERSCRAARRVSMAWISRV